MRRSSLLLALLLALAAPGSSHGEGAAGPDSNPRLRFPGDEIELAMPAKGGRFIVEARVGDAGPFDFFIDTGADVSVIDARIASTLGLDVVGSVPAGVPGAEQVEADRVLIPLLRIGDLEIHDAAPISFDLAEMTGGIMQGVLGMDVFRDVLLTLDPGSARAIISHAELAPDDPGVVRLNASTGRLRFDMIVAGRTVQTEIDTGAPGGFTLPIELIDSVPTLSEPEQQFSAGLVGGARKVRVRKLDGILSFAGLEYENPRIGFMDPSPGIAHIGARILNDLVISVDQRNNLLAFRHAGPSPTATLSEPAAVPRFLGLRFRGTPAAGFTHVASVDPGSLGDRAGFLPGDLLVSLNGQPISEYDQAALGKLIRGTEPLHWVVERDGVRHVIEIQ